MGPVRRTWPEAREELPRGRGVVIMALDKGEKLISASVTVRNKVVIYGTGRGGKEVAVELAGSELTKFRQHRARKGVVIAQKLKPVRLG